MTSNDIRYVLRMMLKTPVFTLVVALTVALAIAANTAMWRLSGRSLRLHSRAMGRAFGFIMVIVVVAIGGYVYMKQAQSVTSVGSNPQTMVDATAVRNDLIGIAKAERNHFASNGKYASLDELQSSGDLTVPSRPNYSYSAQTGESNFKIIATYSGSDPKAPNHVTIDETMALTTD